MSGTLYLVSVGPGAQALIPPLAQKTIQSSEAIVSYDLYLQWIRPWVEAKEIHTLPLTQERERAHKAIELARAGKQVSLISGGDIGIYAMATLAFELMEEADNFSIQVIPGITAANACASLLGAPLSHDFATLSLSDLLCPWEWIEQRATHLAQADLAVVFYNVQSQARQEGIYRILKIFLNHKPSTTWCGVVRNAYRDDQSVQIVPLQSLLQQKFDMHTSLIIGNRFTRKKSTFLYTPRGYGGWSAEAAETLPQNAVWVFSGTRDGNLLAAEIHQQGHRLIVSTATDYGKAVLEQNYPGIPAVSGRKGIEGRRQELKACGAKAILDATHPFADAISKQLIQLSQELHIPYLRFERLPVAPLPEAIICQSMEAAAQTAMGKGQRIFLATGSKGLTTFLNSTSSSRLQWFVRLTPNPTMIQQAVDLGIPRSHICAMQGPFSQAFNEALWQDWQIDCVVTKNSGAVGGVDAKGAASQRLGIPLIVVQPPVLHYPAVVTQTAQALAWVEQQTATIL